MADIDYSKYRHVGEGEATAPHKEGGIDYSKYRHVGEGEATAPPKIRRTDFSKPLPIEGLKRLYDTGTEPVRRTIATILSSAQKTAPIGSKASESLGQVIPGAVRAAGAAAVMSPSVTFPFPSVPEAEAADLTMAPELWPARGTREQPFLTVPRPKVLRGPTPGARELYGSGGEDIFSPTVSSRRDLGIFKGKAEELGQRYGFPVFGKLIEDIANPMTIPETALVSAVLAPAARYGSRLLSEAGRFSRLEALSKEKLPLYPARTSPYGKRGIYERTLAEGRVKFPGEPDSFGVMDTLPLVDKVVKVAGRDVVRKVVAAPTPPLEAAVKIKMAGDAITEQRITPGAVKSVMEGYDAAIKRDPSYAPPADDMKRLFLQVAEALKEGIVALDDLSMDFRKAGYSPEEAARLFRDGASASGKILNILSQYAKKLAPAVEDKIKAVRPVGRTMWEKVFTEGTNLWRAALTSQPATASRNFFSGLAKIGLGSVDDALLGLYEASTGKRPPLTALKPAIEDILAIGRRFTPEGRKRLADMLAESPPTALRLYSTPVSDVALTHNLTRILQVFNTTQEFVVRNATIDAVVTNGMERRGLKIGVDKIPDEVWALGLDRALDNTFAKAPRHWFGKLFYRAWQFPPLQVLTYPFPRYLNNAIRHAYEYSPVQPMSIAMRMASPAFRKEFLTWPIEQQAKVVSRGAVGTSLLYGAVYFRNSKFAGDKYYQFRPFPDSNPGMQIDLRPWGALLAPYMFLAEAYNQFIRGETFGERFSARDWIEGLTGINRLAGAGLFTLGMLTDRPKLETAKETVVGLAGEIIGGFMVPFQGPSDFITAMSEDESIIREKRATRLTGPSLAHIPFASRTLPAAQSPLKMGPLKRENPVLRQLLGVTVANKNIAQQEVDKLGIKANAYYPRTGISDIDNAISAEMAKLAYARVPLFMESGLYQGMHQLARRVNMTRLLQKIRSSAARTVLEGNPEMKARLFERATRQEFKDLMDDEDFEALSQLPTREQRKLKTGFSLRRLMAE